MPGTKEGGKRAAASNKAAHGPDFYAKIGAMGGKKSRGGGFCGPEGRKRASYYGSIGGRKSKRGKPSGIYT